MTNTIKQISQTIKNWWLFLVAGIILIIGSIWVFFTPVESYVALSWLFSILVLADGISQTIFSISNRKELKGWGWRLTGGILMIIIGVILLLYPGISIVILPLAVGFWLLFSGMYLIGTSLELREYYIIEWGWLLLLGVFLAIIAILMILHPLFGAFNVVYLTSLALMIFGVAYIMLALKLKKIKEKTFDVIRDLKKEFKNQAVELKNEIIKAAKELPDNTIEEINRMLDDYEKKIDQK